MTLKYIFPYIYFFRSRLPRMDRRLSWILIEPLPVFLLTYYLAKIPLVEFFVLFLLASAAFMSIYESGYIENDSITTMNEEFPVLRLREDEVGFVLKNIKKIEFFRWATAIMISILIYFLGIKFNVSTNLSLFFLLIISVRVIYIAHNHFRNKSNIITLFLLSSSRYLSIPCLFLELPTITRLLIILVLVYPLPKTLEYAQIKYSSSLKRSITNLNRSLYRLIYYIVLFSIALLIFIITSDRNIYVYIAISLFGYFLAYRFFIFIFNLT